MSTKNNRNGRTSPTKQRTQNASQLNQSAQQEAEVNALNQELIHGLSEKDVEIDHLKTTVVALQEKVVVSISLLQADKSYIDKVSGMSLLIVVRR